MAATVSVSDPRLITKDEIVEFVEALEAAGATDAINRWNFAREREAIIKAEREASSADFQALQDRAQEQTREADRLQLARERNPREFYVEHERQMQKARDRAQRFKSEAEAAKNRSYSPVYPTELLDKFAVRTIKKQKSIAAARHNRRVHEQKAADDQIVRVGGSVLDDMPALIVRSHDVEIPVDRDEQIIAHGKLEQRRLELVSARKKIERAPLPPNELREHVENLVESRAEEPDVSAVARMQISEVAGRIMSDPGSIRWPEISSQVAHVEKYASVTAPDTLGVLCWLFRDQIVERILAEIGEPQGAISINDRDAELKRVTEQLDTLEREESALVWSLIRGGSKIIWRSTTRPENVLGIDITLSEESEFG